MRELKGLKVKLTSILFGEMKPANTEDIIIKAGGFVKNTFEVTKFDELEGILECIVYRANKVDTQGDFISNEELEKACEWNLDYLIKQGKNAPSDTNHNFKLAEGVYLLQTYIDKSENNWIWRQKISIKDNESLMKEAKAGTITGVSLAGEATVEEQEKGILERFMKWVDGKLKKSTLEDFMNRNNREAKEWWIHRIWAAFSSFNKNVVSWSEKENAEVLIVNKEQYDKEVDELATALKSIEFGELFAKSQIKKENDMKKELEDFVKTDEGVKELEALGFKETSKAPELETLKSENETAKKEIETLKSDLAKEQETSKALTEAQTEKADALTKATEELAKAQAEIEQLKSDNAELIKRKITTNIEDEGTKSIEEIIAEKQAEIRANAKQNNEVKK